ncbi:kinase domain-containing protein [Aphelenchoides avenae]|nr:kinase domain-containing protein [Aphelenchus avenae]
MRYVWLTHSKNDGFHATATKVELPAKATVHYYDGRVYALCDGTLKLLNCETGQLGTVDKKHVEGFVEIPLAPMANPCVHGVRCADERTIQVRDVACSESAVYVLDEDEKVWSYGFGRIARNRRGRVEVNQIPFDRPVKKLLAGRNHCIALTITVPVKLDATHRASPAKASSDCEKCAEETNLRLSVLMKSADQASELNNSDAGPSGSADVSGTSTAEEPSTSTPPSRRIRLDKFKLNFGKKGVKSKRHGAALQRVAADSLALRSTNSTPLVSARSDGTNSNDQSMDIELTTVRRQATLNDLTGSVRFSFVSLDNVVISALDHA